MQRLRKCFGSVRKLTGNRRNQYAVHPPKVNGVRPKAICYTSSREIGICILSAWHNGKYYPGMELDLKERALDDVPGFGTATFQEIYDAYWSHKYGESAAKTLGKSSRAGTRAAWKKLESIWLRKLDEVTVQELQEIVNEAAKKYSKSTVEKLITLIKGLYRFAYPRELCRKETGLYVETPKVKEEIHHDAFTDDEINALWEQKNHEEVGETVRMILTMIYSGYRIGAWLPHDGYEGMKVEGDVFIGGVKTEAGKKRQVPIHSSIFPLVTEMSGVFLCSKSESQFRRDFKKTLEKLGIRQLTPHSCRHTFHRLLERAGVSEADRKRLMGHSLKGDITNGAYGHRSVEELRAEVERIEAVRMDKAV